MSEANFRTFFESIKDMIFVAALDGRILFTNSACTQTLGYSAAELAVMQIPDLHPPDCRREAEAIFAAMLRGERQDCPLPLSHKNGSLIPVETRIWFGQWDGKDCLFGLSKDLTAEQEAHQRFERLFRSHPSPMAITILPDQPFADVNDAFLKVLGYSREEVIGKTAADLNLFVCPAEIIPHVRTWEQLVHPDDMPAIREVLTAHLEGRTPFYESEHRLRHKTGKWVWVLDKGKVIERGVNGAPLRACGTHLDITTRKEAEAALRESEEKYQGIFDESVAAIYLFDSNKNFIDANQAGLNLLGYSLEELLGLSIPDVDADPVVVLPAHQELLGGGRLINYEHKLRRKDGAIITVLNNSRPLTDGHGTIVGMLSTLIDITGRRQVEESLKESELRFRNLLEYIPISIQGYGDDGIVRYWNKASEKTYGYSAAEAIGSNLGDLIIPPELKALFAQSLEIGGVARESGEFLPPGELMLLHKNGSLAPVYSIHTVVCLEGKKPVMFCIDVDLSERKRAEEALRQEHAFRASLIERAAEGICVCHAIPDPPLC